MFPASLSSIRRNDVPRRDVQLIGIILKRTTYIPFQNVYLLGRLFLRDRALQSQMFPLLHGKVLPSGFFFCVATLTWICKTSTVRKAAGVYRFARFIEMAATFQTTKDCRNGGSSPIVAISERCCNRANYNKNLRARLNDRADYR